MTISTRTESVPAVAAAKRGWRRLPPLVRITAIPVLSAAAIALLVGQLSSPASFTARGTAQVCADAPDIADGGTVTVTDSAGHVIGTGTLAADSSPAAARAEQAYSALQTGLGDLGNSAGMSLYTFTVTGLPGGLSRYGISVGQARGTVWFSPQQAGQPALNLGC